MGMLHCREPTYFAAAFCSDKPYLEIGREDTLNESRDVQVVKAQVDKASWYCWSAQRHDVSVEAQEVTWLVSNCCWQCR